MKRYFLLFGVIGFVTLSAMRRADWLGDLLQKLEEVRSKYPQEKVHLHLDKPHYSVGDDIWLKAYVVNAENNELSALSKILYVDLLNERDSVCKTVAMQLSNGLADAALHLDDTTFAAGNYRIKAYTRWMQNFDTDYFFSKDIRIGDARKASDIIATAFFNNDQPGKVVATVRYRLISDGRPLEKRPVNYDAIYKNKMIYSGRSVTGENGELQISVPLAGVDHVDSIYINTSAVLANKSTVKRNFRVNVLTGKPDVRFFPEGGTLVVGCTSRVGVKAVAPDGRGWAVSGKILDSKLSTVAQFATEHAGMGTFFFEPKGGEKYIAEVRLQNGTSYTYPVPVAAPAGYVLAVGNKGESLMLKVSSAGLSATSKETAIVGIQNGVLRYAAKLTFVNGAVNAVIPASKFSTGIVQLTLIAADGAPLAERLIFVDHNDQLRMEMKTAKPFYSKREQVTVDLSLSDDDGTPVEGNLSLAVTDTRKVKANDAESTMISDLLLTSDLKGYVEDPGYYFDDKNPDRHKHLDDLLLTQGWRRFTWAQINNSALPVISDQPQQDISVSGTVTTLNGVPVPKGKVSLYANAGSGLFLADTVADANGRFRIDGLTLTGNVKVVVRGKDNRNGTHVKIVLDSDPTPAYTHHSGSAYTNDEDMVSYLQSTQKLFDELEYGLLPGFIALDEVKVKDTKINDKYTVKGSSKLGSGVANIVIKKEKVNSYQNLWFAFYGLPNVEVRPNRKIYSVGRVVSITRPNREPMLLRVDGVAADQSLLQFISPKDVEGIEIFQPGSGGAIYGDEGYWGVIEITTKKGTPDILAQPVTGINSIMLRGLAEPREFYAPVYDGALPEGARKDLRSTVYWQPNVIANENGKASVLFYTADEPSVYRIVVEGINMDGKLVRKTHMIEVR